MIDRLEWIEKKPLLKEILSYKEVFWKNPKYSLFNDAIKDVALSINDVIDAKARLERFAPYIEKVFPETQASKGIIESPLVKIPNMKSFLMDKYQSSFDGDLLLKCDHKLPISGSIKARGGIYEVLKHAEELAINHQILTYQSDYSILDSDEIRNFFHQYKIAVGSTGNLGLSIGIISAKLGFKVYVHMSRDAKAWKKDLLRSHGVKVIEYDADYSEAVKQGRIQAHNDRAMYFIDDENSKDLFLGYAVSALRLKDQLDALDISVNESNPLYVYLPCGVGGGPGGVAFGLKLLFKDNVHCFFAEPTHSPCMLLGLLTECHDQISVQDFGLDNQTIADGLAVGRPSGFVGKTLERLISGVYTIADERLLSLLRAMIDKENIALEPSALAGLYGVVNLENKTSGTHLAWATGGGMVPKEIMKSYYTTKF